MAGGAITDRSSNIASGTVAVSIAANEGRRYLMIQNPSTATQQNIGAAESLFVRFTGVAAVNGATSIELIAGASITFDAPLFVPTGVISINATTTNHRFIAMEG